MQHVFFFFLQSLFLKMVSKLSAHHEIINRNSTAIHPCGCTLKERKKTANTYNLFDKGKNS